MIDSISEGRVGREVLEYLQGEGSFTFFLCFRTTLELNTRVGTQLQFIHRASQISRLFYFTDAEMRELVRTVSLCRCNVRVCVWRKLTPRSTKLGSPPGGSAG